MVKFLDGLMTLFQVGEKLILLVLVMLPVLPMLFVLFWLIKGLWSL